MIIFYLKLYRELIENLSAGRQQKINVQHQLLLTEQLVATDNEIKATLKVAEHQAEVEKKVDAIKEEIETQDQHITQMQKHFKEAENILATALFQAKQKLQSINKASKHPVSSEDLIKYAHRISASNAVCAPLTWQPGDARRPYPTDIEMRMGYLGRLSDLPLNGHIMQPQGLADMVRSNNQIVKQILKLDRQASQQNQFAWHSTGDMHIGVNSGVIDTRNHSKDVAEDVEVMSTDSSSSSSSDSQ
ncbi:mediator of RNA polymerase II transcription subunit 4 [Aphis craccivora]|uniref:Mediator of RNA polymerase II transcription subunit 4 n=1 Tax=Aphis craccivora TaxID=307492 RepID=A0A6G0ZN17_APHCR|nr:mediator of RNA polymerase II transcription subunit 4 [Aphis craccivora]